MKKQFISGVVALSLLFTTMPTLAANDTGKQAPKIQKSAAQKGVRTFGPFIGVVQTVENGTITTTGKTLGKRTIITTPETQIMDGDKKIELKDIAKGAHIRVIGTSTDKTDKTITAKKITLVKKAKVKTQAKK